ncbi:2-keto-4-pentenoate hydratase [Jannaschia ovalis]|uniref:Fumarylacetoacetate hydrolase family protein n=1 Tax=Jannaschia ovalis TaxID=3038773 RepID=A0ABY8L7Z9_9RHOB|nr:fumarylacetoacetate hydrolase family protein [Jannaschia sp. GRR-S6-38]WGH77421.1 fumarylacetoacetate hydrolase family protein [Jannaschia sp. GRR-S6-38]
MSRLKATILSAVALPLLATAAMSECATDAEVAAYVDGFLAAQPTRALAAGGTMEDALCTQAKVVAMLTQEMGPVIGYKAGLTSAPAQERFGASEPVHGVLYRDMLLENGAAVAAQFGARPVFEADLILVVGSDAINQASSAEEAIAHISAVHPFLELADVSYATDEPVNAITLTANGVAAKLGVLGAAIPVDDAAEMLAALETMTVTVTASDGEVLSSAQGSAVLGNPVNAALWLMSKEIVFKPGDLISVGSIGPLMPPAKANGRAEARYVGLPGDPVVSVVFE